MDGFTGVREYGRGTNKKIAAARQTGLGKTWGNVRIVLGQDAKRRIDEWTSSEDIGSNDKREEGTSLDETVARLYFTNTTHPVIRDVLEGFEVTESMSLPALAIQNLMNNRGPDALVGSIPGEMVHSARLLDMCRVCHDMSSVLVSRTQDVDVVLVPRKPDVAEKDSLSFLVYATNVKAVNLCELLRKEKQVAVVLDVDNTLVDAEPYMVDDSEEYTWIEHDVCSSNGTLLHGRIAHLTEAGESKDQDGSFVIQWSYPGTWAAHPITFCFLVRIRKGWNFFRSFLIENEHKFMTFVCSMGKREYVELIWHGLDPGFCIIPRDAWGSRISSTYPDTLNEAAKKTALLALSCSTVHDRYAETHLAAPYMCIDDSPESYEEPYTSSVLLIDEFTRENSDSGTALSLMTHYMNTYWDATCGELGTFAWQAAQSFSTAILHAMQSTVMESPNALQYLQSRCSKQGELLWRQITVEYVLPGLSAKSHVETVNAIMQTRRSLDDSLARGFDTYAPHPIPNIALGRRSISSTTTSPIKISKSVPRGTVPAEGDSLSPDERLDSYMMMQC